jgi:hypothetical protein
MEKSEAIALIVDRLLRCADDCRDVADRLPPGAAQQKLDRVSDDLRTHARLLRQLAGEDEERGGGKG